MPKGFRGRVLEDDGTLTLLAAPQSYTLVAKTGNQESVAAALDGFIPATSGDKQVVSIALDELTEKQYPGAFEQIMPSIYQSVAYLSIDLINDLAQVVDQRIGVMRLGARGLSVQGLGNVAVYNTDKAGASKSVVDSKKDIIRQEADNKWGVWVVGNGVFARNYNISDVPNARFSSGGFVAGLDYNWNETWSTGLFVGYQGGYASYPNDGSMNMNGTNFGGYLNWDSGSGFYSNAMVMGGYNSYRVHRPIEFGTIDRTANSRYGGGDVSTFLSLGYDFKIGRLAFGPVISGQYTYMGFTSFTENGADSLNLRVGGQSYNSMRMNVGGRIAYTWQVNDKVLLIPEVRMFWQHEFLQNPTDINASLNGGGGPGFTYRTSVAGRDSVFAGAGINAQIGRHWMIGAYYNIDFASSTSIDNIVSANLGYSF